VLSSQNHVPVWTLVILEIVVITIYVQSILLWLQFVCTVVGLQYRYHREILLWLQFVCTAHYMFIKRSTMVWYLVDRERPRWGTRQLGWENNIFAFNLGRWEISHDLLPIELTRRNNYFIPISSTSIFRLEIYSWTLMRAAIARAMFGTWSVGKEASLEKRSTVLLHE
jgi:hypothetical protein